jgi:ABC-type transport system involved in cytochrome c biogenesis permease component
MNLKLKKLEITLALDNMMNDDVGIAFELTLFPFNIKWEVCSVLASFLSFSKTYENNNNNIISLMLNPTFISLHIISSIICHEQVGLLLKIMIGSFCILCF